jgi:hypothetical protein
MVKAEHIAYPPHRPDAVLVAVYPTHRLPPIFPARLGAVGDGLPEYRSPQRTVRARREVVIRVHV